jgi:hypothetical protein
VIAHACNLAVFALPSKASLAEEAKIETDQEENEIDNRALTADPNRFDKTSTLRRHQNTG